MGARTEREAFQAAAWRIGQPTACDPLAGTSLSMSPEVRRKSRALLVPNLPHLFVWIVQVL